LEAASTSETSVNFYQTTRRNNPEDSHLHTCRRENLKSHNMNYLGKEARKKKVETFSLKITVKFQIILCPALLTDVCLSVTLLKLVLRHANFPAVVGLKITTPVNASAVNTVHLISAHF
jgi:hypothetical protein